MCIIHIYSIIFLICNDVKGEPLRLFNPSRMHHLVKNLIRTLPHNISEVVFGGDFNSGFKNGLFSEFKDVKLYTLPQYEVYSTHDNFGKRNEQNVDYIITYKLF